MTNGRVTTLVGQLHGMSSGPTLIACSQISSRVWNNVVTTMKRGEAPKAYEAQSRYKVKL